MRCTYSLQRNCHQPKCETNVNIITPTLISSFNKVRHICTTNQAWHQEFALRPLAPAANLHAVLRLRKLCVSNYMHCYFFQPNIWALIVYFKLKFNATMFCWFLKNAKYNLIRTWSKLRFSNQGGYKLTHPLRVSKFTVSAVKGHSYQ